MQNLLLPIFIQTPTAAPTPGSSSPIDFNSTFDIIVFIVLPILMIVFYFIWKQQKNNKL
ncbi:MAG: adenylosuccinate synthetase [Winogradskyella arenosi]